MPQRPSVSLLLVSICRVHDRAPRMRFDKAAAADPRTAGRTDRADALRGRLPDASRRYSAASTATGSLVPLTVDYYIGKTGTLHYYMADPAFCKCMYVGTEEDYQQYEKLKLNEQFQAKEGEVSRENLEAQQMEIMDEQEEMFNPYGIGLVGPMGPAMYW